MRGRGGPPEQRTAPRDGEEEDERVQERSAHCTPVCTRRLAPTRELQEGEGSSKIRGRKRRMDGTSGRANTAGTTRPNAQSTVTAARARAQTCTQRGHHVAW